MTEGRRSSPRDNGFLKRRTGRRPTPPGRPFRGLGLLLRSLWVLVIVGVFTALFMFQACRHRVEVPPAPAIVHPQPVYFLASRAVTNAPSAGAVTLLAVGDLMFGRRVESARQGKEDPDPLAAVRETLAQADITFGNLECVLGQEGDFADWKAYDKIRLGAPAGSVESLSASGFDIVSLGNNHVLDFGKEGLESTVRILKNAGIESVGLWKAQGLNKPVVLDVKGVRVAFLAYSDVSPATFKADSDSPGTIPPLPDILKRDIREARKSADRVVVSVHWGEEYRRVPTPKQRRLAREMVDLGADLVLGHHPHVVQPFERYRAGFIVYSLGNFLFDLRSPRAKESMVLKVVFDKGWKPRVWWAPVEIQGTFPIFLEGEKASTAAHVFPTRLPKLAAPRGGGR